jgi:hypothetical protein
LDYGRMAIFGSRTSRPAHWLKVALERSQIAGRVIRIGSGFIMDGAVVGENFAGVPQAPDLMSRSIADFRHWESPVAFETALNRLLNALRSAS